MDTLQSVVDHGHTTKCGGSWTMDTLKSSGSWNHYKV